MRHNIFRDDRPLLGLPAEVWDDPDELDPDDDEPGFKMEDRPTLPPLMPDFGPEPMGLAVPVQLSFL